MNLEASWFSTVWGVTCLNSSKKANVLLLLKWPWHCINIAVEIFWGLFKESSIENSSLLLVFILCLTFTRSIAVFFFFPLHLDWQTGWLEKHITLILDTLLSEPTLWSLLCLWIIYLMWCVFPWIHRISFCPDVSSHLWGYKYSWLNLSNGWTHTRSFVWRMLAIFLFRSLLHFH